jgi:bacterioferritin-associated ferredoxin
MIVCQCKGITDDAIRAAVREGACTIGEVGAACLAGTECECCHEAIATIIEEERALERKESSQ